MNDYEQLDALGKRARERLAQITPGQGDATLPLDDKFMVARALMQEVAALKKYIDELEMIIYHSVTLGDILHNGDSKATYKQINAKWDQVAQDAWGRLKGHADE